MASLCQTYFIFVMYTLIIYTQQQQKDPAFMATYNKYVTDCAKEVGLQEDYVRSVWSANHFPNDPKLKCYFKCTCLKLGLINEAGDVIDDVLKKVEIQFTDANTDEEIVTECGGISGADLCDTAYKLVGCIKAAELD